jgi:hypothetical protein
VSNYTLPPCSTLLCGMTGSGKRTFALQYLPNVAAAGEFYRPEPTDQVKAVWETLLVGLHQEEQVPDALADGPTPLQSDLAAAALEPLQVHRPEN